MLLSRLLANFTRGESDKLRKAMGKKQMAVLASLKDKFMDGGKANGHNPEILDKIWKDWEKFASYAFNKSHAACYSWVAYQTGYLKAHYPAEFMAANLTVHKDDIKEVTKLMDECRALGLSVLEPDVNESELSFIVNSKGDIRFGLGGIKGVGEGAAEAIIQEREKNGKYTSIFDFLERVNLQSCNRKTIECLAQAGAFGCFKDIYREQILGTYDGGTPVLDALMQYGNHYQQDRENSQNSLFGDLAAVIEVRHPELPNVPKWDTIERLNREKDLIGIYLSAHPLDEYEFEVKELCNLTAHELSLFRGWEQPDARKNAELRIRTEIAETMPESEIEPVAEDALDYSADNADNDSGEEMPAAEMPKASPKKEEEPTDRPLLPSEFIAKHKNKVCFFGGIIVNAEQLISKKGNPYGKYTIEDYTGSYNFTLFGSAYQQFGHLMLKNMYVLVTGVIQQKNAGQRWFREQPDEQAEYEFVAQHVDTLGEVQDQRIEGINLQLSLNDLSGELIQDLQDQIKANPGNDRLHISVYNPMNRHRVSLTSRGHSIRITPAFYRWLCVKRMEGTLDFTVITK